MLKICNKCGFQQDEFLNIDGRNRCKSCNAIIEINNNKIQDSITISAYQRETVHHILFTTTEWLEKYIEIAGYYPDWENRKQIADNGVVRTDIIGNPKEAEEWFSTTLFGLRQSLENKPKSLRDELKAEFYQWINATGINVNNCPERLKHILFGFNEVLEGKGEKIMREMMNKEETLDVNASDYAEKLNSFYFSVQAPLDEGRERERLLKNKKSNEISIKNKFGVGNIDDLKKGEEIFNKISNEVASKHDEFHFFPQKKEQRRPWAEGTPTVLTNKIKQSIHEWNIKEVIVFDGYSNRNYYGEIKELALVHNSVNLNNYNHDEQGCLRVDPRKIYFKDSLSVEEWNQIEQLKARENYFSQVSLNNPQQQTNSGIIQDVRQNPQNWSIDEVITGYSVFNRAKKEEVLIYHSAQLGPNGEVIGSLNSQPVYLLTRNSRFSPGEIAEIKQAKNISQTSTSQPIRWDLVNNIKQHANEFKLEKVLFLNERGDNYDEEDWLIHNSAERKSDQNGCLVFDSDKMIKLKDLNEAEKEAIGYKSEQGLQSISTSRENNFDKGIGKGGIFAIITAVGVLLIAGVAVVKKRSSRKVKR